MDNKTQKITSSICQEILNKMNELINLTEINRIFPFFIHNQCVSITFCNFQASQVDPETINQNGMKQQKLQEVISLQKDSLMPKGIERQSQQVDKVSQMEEVGSKNKKKNLNGTKTSFNRSNIHSVSNTNRNSKTSQLQKIKKKNQSPFISLVQDQEDPEAIADLRKRKDLQWNSNQNEIKMLQEKQKQFLMKKQKFVNQLSDKGYTFDFTGDAINSTIEEQKINYYTMKARLSIIDKRIRTNKKFRQSQNQSQLKINLSKKVVLKDLPSMSIQLNPIIPVFEQQNVDPSSIFGFPNQKEKCKLKQYKKHFSGRFSRADKSLNTIDLSHSQKNDQFQKLFSQRRYLKDEQKIFNQSMVSNKTKLEHITKRKLALPKIHGKYSTLDRYQQY